MREVRDLEGKRIATELVNVTRDFLEERGVKPWSSTPTAPPRSSSPLLADAIVDVTVTGNSLRANNLRIVETVIESTPRLIASKQAWDDPWKRQKIEDIALMLRGAMAAEGKVWLSMNVPRERSRRCPGDPAGAGQADGLVALRPGLGRRDDDRRRERRARDRAEAEEGGRARHRRVSAEQDHRVAGFGAASPHPPKGRAIEDRVRRRRGAPDDPPPPAASETELGPAGRARTAAVFGAELSGREAVQRIIADVRREGDAAVRRYCEAFDGVALPRARGAAGRDRAALGAIEPELRDALEFAAGRIKRYHEGQRDAVSPSLPGGRPRRAGARYRDRGLLRARARTRSTPRPCCTR